MIADAIVNFVMLAGLFAGLVWWIEQSNKQILKTMATVAERLSAVESALDEGAQELVAELAKLREQIANGTVTEEALATIGRLETKATALANIIPNAPTA